MMHRSETTKSSKGVKQDEDKKEGAWIHRRHCCDRRGGCDLRDKEKKIQLGNVPQVVGMIESIEVRDEKRSHWTAIGPAGLRVTWDAEITTDRENEMIGWRSIDGSMLETAGYIRFERATGGRGTLVRVALEYSLPSGRVGGAIASILGKNPGTYLDQALRRFKQRMEVGEIARAS